MRMPKPWKSIRWKMSILAAVLLGGILILYSLYLFFQIQQVLFHNLDAELKVKALELAQTIKAFQDTKSPGGDIRYAAVKVLDFDIESPPDQSLQLADRQWLRLVDRYDLNRDYVSILSLEGEVLASNRRIPDPLREQLTGMFSRRPRIRPAWETISYGDEGLRVIQTMILARDQPHYYIQIATPLLTVRQFLSDRLWGIAGSILVVVVLFGLIGLLMANRILHPVREITEAAQTLTPEDLSRRVEVGEVDYEMLFLVNAFNRMTRRLADAFKHMSGMTAWMAHELKTPLAVIRGEGQAALRRERPAQEYRQVIESGIAETDKMIRVIDDLLTAANLAYDRKIFQLRIFRLSEFLEEITRKSRILSEPKDIRVELGEVDDELMVRGDRIHLRRLFFNLIDNAIKNSPPGSLVSLSARREGTGVLVSVADQGKGIAPEDLPRIFDRDYRGNRRAGTEAGSPEGSGLGLYLCRVISEAHGGELRVKSQPGEGSVFSLYLPAEKIISRRRSRS
jgi:two-component system, OmpR family, heavy metal sensor histidine kinase CusS